MITEGLVRAGETAVIRAHPQRGACEGTTVTPHAVHSPSPPHGGKITLVKVLQEAFPNANSGPRACDTHFSEDLDKFITSRPGIRDGQCQRVGQPFYWGELRPSPSAPQCHVRGDKQDKPRALTRRTKEHTSKHRFITPVQLSRLIIKAI